VSDDRASLAVVHPATGEMLDVKTEPTDVLADLHESFSAQERDLRSYRRTVDDELVERMDHEGVRTSTARASRSRSASQPSASGTWTCCWRRSTGW
jgi:hypothetical protein